MKLNELKMEMRKIRDRLTEEVVKSIKFKDSEYKIHNILVNRRDDNAISIAIICSTKSKEENKKIRGYIRYFDNDKAEYKSYSKKFKEAISNSDEILNIVFNLIKNNKMEINNLLDEYVNTEYKLTLQIRDTVKFKKSNISNIDLCDPKELEWVKVDSSNINRSRDTFYICLPLKAMVDGKRKFNEMEILVKDGVVKSDSWYLDSTKDIFEDSVENIDEINRIVENFIKEN